ncbi:MAG: hypothetical protein ABI354_03465 [Candidatus Saccharimonadales bacterium]
MIKSAKSKLIQIIPEEYRKFVKNKRRDGFDRLIVILGLINVVMTIPQVIEIWSSPNAKAVSVISWSYYVFFTGTLLVYAISIKSKPMIISYSANSIVYAVVLVSAIVVKSR